ncbi:hypothetical protein [Nocardia puris]|uniref:Uncharacterized protein n=1 Tax=Nocardia puris TaxID=208602 RepID=A0A366DJC2_9NOCA|nr:hypothetical protein [Nocardia puris]RBO90126.1 hypothetical protein DFR74_10610 [Nocardia puris]
MREDASGGPEASGAGHGPSNSVRAEDVTPIGDGESGPIDAESWGPSARARVLRGAPAGVAVVALIGLLVALGVAIPPRELGVGTDRLGPDHGERVGDYLDRARASLSGDHTETRWALITFGEPLASHQIPDHTAGLRVAQVLYRVPLPRVQTPLVTVAVPSTDVAATNSSRWAAGALQAELDLGTDPESRYTATLSASAARLRADCACVVGVIVRGPLPPLRTLLDDPTVRAVEALPADATTFAVTPLLPDHTDVVGPGPDDGPVPVP